MLLVLLHQNKSTFMLFNLMLYKAEALVEVREHLKLWVNWIIKCINAVLNST